MFALHTKCYLGGRLIVTTIDGTLRQLARLKRIGTELVSMKGQENFRISCENFFVYLDNHGNIGKIVFHDKQFEPLMRYTLYEINGQVADVSKVPSRKAFCLKLATIETSGRLIISPGKEIKMIFRPEKKDLAKNLSLILPFPLETEFHLPETYNLGRQIDRDMAVGETYSTSLGYNFFLANSNGMWIRFMTRQPRLNSARVHISRHPEIFIATFTWKASEEAYVNVFGSMDEAVRDYKAWLEKELAVKKLRERPNLPGWVHNVKLVLIVDMMRSNWEVTHDYNDVTNLADDLEKIGCPRDTMLYIPGWNGAYDSAYPTYQPCSELGGEEKFGEMVKTLHKNGFRVMIHANAWGLDPYHPNIDRFLKYVLKDEEGNFQGWQTGRRIQAWGVTAPESRPLKFRSGRIRIKGSKGAKSFTFETAYVPDNCEALIAIGNLRVGDARVKLTTGRRSILTPSAWFSEHDEYAFPFPLQLKTGVNKVHIEVVGDAAPDWTKSWYEIRHCFVPLNTYTSWTHPILLADTTSPEWIGIFVDEVESAVRKYSIDAVHVDATEYYHSKKILNALKERLPDIPVGGEGLASLEDLGYWTFCQNARQSMLGYLDMTHGTCQQGSLPDRSGVRELYGWLEKISPFCNFLKDYVYVYPHLCAADAFVPVGKVCNTFHPRLSPRCPKELWKVLREAQRLNYIPALRLNYRKYGIDEETKKAVQEIARL